VTKWRRSQSCISNASRSVAVIVVDVTANDDEGDGGDVSSSTTMAEEEKDNDDDDNDAGSSSRMRSWGRRSRSTREANRRSSLSVLAFMVSIFCGSGMVYLRDHRHTTFKILIH
jgi:hypothetical protein